MTDHYYTQSPKSKSEKQTIEAWIQNEKMKFTTDIGVFSKSDVDFGSRLLIETIIEEAKTQTIQGQKWLDLGCGYGAIGISLLRHLPELQLTMVDINERALACTKENLRNYHLSNVRVLQSDGLDAVLDERYSRIITNPPIRAGKQMIHSWYEKSYELLEDAGQLWLVIQKKQGAPSTWEKLKSIFPTAEEMAREKGYHIFRAMK